MNEHSEEPSRIVIEASAVSFTSRIEERERGSPIDDGSESGELESVNERSILNHTGTEPSGGSTQIECISSSHIGLDFIASFTNGDHTKSKLPAHAARQQNSGELYRSSRSGGP